MPSFGRKKSDQPLQQLIDMEQFHHVVDTIRELTAGLDAGVQAATEATRKLNDTVKDLNKAADKVKEVHRRSPSGGRTW